MEARELNVGERFTFTSDYKTGGIEMTVTEAGENTIKAKCDCHNIEFSYPGEMQVDLIEELPF